MRSGWAHRAEQAMALKVRAQTQTSIPAPTKLKVENTKPMGKRVLVRPEQAAQRTAAGLVLESSTSGTETGVAEVLQVGDDVDEPTLTQGTKAGPHDISCWLTHGDV